MCSEKRRGSDGPIPPHPPNFLVFPAVLQEEAASKITLTTHPDEVSAAATLLQLQPYLSSTLLAAALEAPMGEQCLASIGCDALVNSGLLSCPVSL